MTTIIRRRKLGRTSVREIVRYMETPAKALRSDRRAFPDDLYIRWGCTANVPCKDVLNVSKAIHRVNDKACFRMLCAEKGLAPPSVIVEAHPFDDSGVAFDDTHLTYPLIMRPRNHSQGRNVILATRRADLIVQGRRFPNGWYASNLIAKVAEYRVFVVSGRVACVAEKTPANKDDLAWNVAKGGRFDVTPWKQWPLRAVKTAIEAFSLSGLDFGGVDVMVDAEGKPYVLEINSAPSLTSPYRQQCMAKCFDYIVRNGKAIIPLIEAKGGYSKFIHPAVCDHAKLVGGE